MQRLTTLLLAATICGACQTTDNREVVTDLLRRGSYPEAIELASQAREEGLDWAAQAIDRARLGMLLERGRELTFAGEHEKALEVFGEAHAMAPNEPITELWLAKSEGELTSVLLDQAKLSIDRDDFHTAREIYQRALSYGPENSHVLTGIERTERSLSYRTERSEEYFREGWHGFRNGDLAKARRELAVAIKYDPFNEKAKERLAEVDRSFVQFYLARAEGLCDEGFWAAAQLEIRQAKLLVADDANVLASSERIDAEVGALRLVNEASMRARRQDFDGATSLLDEAEALSERQGDAISRGRAAVEDGRFEELYLEARGFERDYRHTDALAEYESLLAQAEFYKDAISRRDTLKEFLTAANELYERMLNEPDEAKAASYLRQITVMLPEFRDVDQRLEALQTSAEVGS